jgi:hypothetical protein
LNSETNIEAGRWLLLVQNQKKESFIFPRMNEGSANNGSFSTRTFVETPFTTTPASPGKKQKHIILFRGKVTEALPDLAGVVAVGTSMEEDPHYFIEFSGDECRARVEYSKPMLVPEHVLFLYVRSNSVLQAYAFTLDRPFAARWTAYYSEGGERWSLIEHQLGRIIDLPPMDGANLLDTNGNAFTEEDLHCS